MKAAPAIGLSLAAVLLLPLHRGGYPDEARVAFGVIVSVSLILAGVSRSRRPMDWLYASSLILWLSWLGWQIVQLLPMPPELLALLAPASFEHHEQVRQLGLAPEYRIALSRSAAQASLAWSAFLFALYLTLSQSVQGKPQRITWCLMLIVAGAALQAAYGTFNLLTGFSIPLIQPDAGLDDVAHGTFPNRNHYAAYLTLGSAAALALLLGAAASSRTGWASPVRRLFDLLSGPYAWIRLALLAIVIAIVLTQSRMGNIALALGISTFAVVWLLTTSSIRTLSGALLLFLSIAVVDILLISERFGLERVIERIETTDLSRETRLSANEMSWELTQRFRFSGAGLGSYRLLEHQVRPDPRIGYLAHAHNDYLEFMIEAGWIGSALLAALLLVHFGFAMQALTRKRRGHKATGAAVIMVLAAAGAHATVEFNFQIPGYSASFVALLAIVASIGAPAARRRPTRRTPFTLIKDR